MVLDNWTWRVKWIAPLSTGSTGQTQSSGLHVSLTHCPSWSVGGTLLERLLQHLGIVASPKNNIFHQKKRKMHQQSGYWSKHCSLRIIPHILSQMTNCDMYQYLSRKVPAIWAGNSLSREQSLFIFTDQAKKKKNPRPRGEVTLDFPFSVVCPHLLSIFNSLPPHIQTLSPASSFFDV